MPLEIYKIRVAEEITNNKWDAVIAHSMGGLLIPDEIEKIPVVIIESPINGVTGWQFKVINLLAAIKGIGGFPLNNYSVKGMLRSSEFIQSRKLTASRMHIIWPLWASHALQINGALACNPLARHGGNTFGKIPGIQYLEFPKLDHIGILSDPEVIMAVLNFLKSAQQE